MAGKGVTIEFDDKGLEQISAFRDVLIERFQYIGEQAVNEARSKYKSNDWKDRSGNLRSSIGYVVLDNGKPVVQGKSAQYGEGTEGADAARQLLEKLRGEFPKGLVLIVCAGMNYASYVESKGYNVLSSANLIAERLANDLLEQLSK